MGYDRGFICVLFGWHVEHVRCCLMLWLQDYDACHFDNCWLLACFCYLVWPMRHHQPKAQQIWKYRMDLSRPQRLHMSSRYFLKDQNFRHITLAYPLHMSTRSLARLVSKIILFFVEGKHILWYWNRGKHLESHSDYFCWWYTRIFH